MCFVHSSLPQFAVSVLLFCSSSHSFFFTSCQFLPFCFRASLLNLSLQFMVLCLRLKRIRKDTRSALFMLHVMYSSSFVSWSSISSFSFLTSCCSLVVPSSSCFDSKSFYRNEFLSQHLLKFDSMFFLSLPTLFPPPSLHPPSSSSGFFQVTRKEHSSKSLSSWIQVERNVFLSL